MRAISMLLVLPLFTIPPTTARSTPAAEASTIIVAAATTERPDALVGDLRFAQVHAVYSSGSDDGRRMAKRLADAFGVSMIPYDSILPSGSTGAEQIATEWVRAPRPGVVAVVVDRDAMLSFLRRLTKEPRASFPSRIASDDFWIVTVTHTYTSAVRGQY